MSNITISNVKNQELWLQFQKYLQILLQGIIIYYLLMYLTYCVRTYVMFGFVPPVLVIWVCSYLYYGFTCGNVCLCDYMHACTFIRNIRLFDSLQYRSRSGNYLTLGRNIFALASARIRANASAIILTHTSVFMFERAHSSAIILARASTSICARGGCSLCLSVILSNTHTHNVFFSLCQQSTRKKRSSVIV